MSVATRLIQNYAIDVPLQKSGSYRIGDIRHNYADISKINKLLDFVPLIDFEIGIDRFTSWVNNQEIGYSKYSDSLVELKEKGLMK